MPSALVNLACAVCAVAAVCRHGKEAPVKILLRYFTVLSNLLCALAALTVAVCRLGGGEIPYVVGVFKYVGTAAVTVTLLTVVFFLGPTLGYKLMFTGPDLWLHLICPLLAVVSLLLWDKPELPFGAAFLGTLPVALYGAVYIRRVRFAPEQRRWPDFYGFNRGGKWLASLLIMLAATFLISVVLLLV